MQNIAACNTELTLKSTLPWELTEQFLVWQARKVNTLQKEHEERHIHGFSRNCEIILIEGWVQHLSWMLYVSHRLLLLVHGIHKALEWKFQHSTWFFNFKNRYFWITALCTDSLQGMDESLYLQWMSFCHAFLHKSVPSHRHLNLQ